jgi:hypothetical protein
MKGHLNSKRISILDIFLKKGDVCDYHFLSLSKIKGIFKFKSNQILKKNGVVDNFKTVPFNYSMPTIFSIEDQLLTPFAMRNSNP